MPMRELPVIAKVSSNKQAKRVINVKRLGYYSKQYLND